MNDISININSNLVLSKTGDISYLSNTDNLDDIVWINYETDSITSVQDKFKIHPITVEDILSNEREKIEHFDNYILIIFKNKEFNNINLLLFDKLLVSFSNSNFTDQIVDKLKSNKCEYNNDTMVHLIIDTIVDNYVPIVHNLFVSIDKLNDEIINESEVDKKTYYIKTTKINKLIKETSTLYRSILLKKEIVDQLTNKTMEKYVSRDIKIYFQDVLDNILKMHEWLVICKENISHSQSTYMSFLTLEATLSSDETNLIMRRLTSAATILMTVTIISSLFGMNVQVPGQNSDGLHWFFGICGFTAFVIVLMWLMFKRWKLL